MISEYPNYILFSSEKVFSTQEAANRSLCSLSESSLECSQTVLDTGMLDCIKRQLDGTDAGVKEAGLDAVSSIANGSEAMATTVADAELLPPIVQHLNFPESPTRLVTSACNALTHVAAHNSTLAQLVHGTGLYLTNSSGRNVECMKPG